MKTTVTDERNSRHLYYLVLVPDNIITVATCIHSFFIVLHCHDVQSVVYERTDININVDISRLHVRLEHTHS